MYAYLCTCLFNADQRVNFIWFLCFSSFTILLLETTATVLTCTSRWVQRTHYCLFIPHIISQYSGVDTHLAFIGAKWKNRNLFNCCDVRWFRIFDITFWKYSAFWILNVCRMRGMWFMSWHCIRLETYRLQKFHDVASIMALIW